MNKVILHLDEYIEYLNKYLCEIDEHYRKHFYGHWNDSDVQNINNVYNN